MPPLWKSALKNARGFRTRGLEKAPQKTLRFYHIYHSADGGLISHSSLLFFFSISSWTYYKATPSRIG